MQSRCVRGGIWRRRARLLYHRFCGIARDGSQEKTLKNGIPQITVQELKQRLDAGEDLMILDVREPFEYQIANIGGTLIPQGEVPKRLAEIDRNREIIVQCRSGGRSQRIAEFLAAQGYPNVKNLAGGILAWADQIDPKLTKY
jgi:sulfur-carrier protein adenylyltransferase/sulfurtransferase